MHADWAVSEFEGVVRGSEVVVVGVIGISHEGGQILILAFFQRVPYTDGSIIERLTLDPQATYLATDTGTNYAGLILLTLGAEGAEAYRDGDLVGTGLPPLVEPIDTVGAGDAFCGALITELAGGSSIEDSLPAGCEAGALATTRRGAQF